MSLDNLNLMNMFTDHKIALIQNSYYLCIFYVLIKKILMPNNRLEKFKNSFYCVSKKK